MPRFLNNKSLHIFTSLSPDVIHNLMFSLSRYTGIWQKHLQDRSVIINAQQYTKSLTAEARSWMIYRDITPARVIGQSFCNVITQTLGQIIHKLCSLCTKQRKNKLENDKTFKTVQQGIYFDKSKFRNEKCASCINRTVS